MDLDCLGGNEFSVTLGRLIFVVRFLLYKVRIDKSTYVIDTKLKIIDMKLK